MTARQASQQLAGSIERPLGAVVTASDAVVVIDAALDVVGDYPELENSSASIPTRSRQTRGTLVSVARELRRRTTSSAFRSRPARSPTAEQLDAVDAALQDGGRVPGEMSAGRDSSTRRPGQRREAERGRVGLAHCRRHHLAGTWVGWPDLPRPLRWRKLRRLPA